MFIDNYQNNTSQMIEYLTEYNDPFGTPPEQK